MKTLCLLIKVERLFCKDPQLAQGKSIDKIHKLENQIKDKKNILIYHASE